HVEHLLSDRWSAHHALVTRQLTISATYNLYVGHFGACRRRLHSGPVHTFLFDWPARGSGNGNLTGATSCFAGRASIFYGVCAGVELFGILGALFVAPVVGVLQAVIISFWKEWRTRRPEQFPMKKAVAEDDVSIEPASPRVE